MKFHLVFLLLFIGIAAKSQEVLWANELLEVSSEKADSSPRYKAIQALGEPNVLPQFEKSASAWQPSGSNFGEDYIKVGFEKAIKIQQIAIAENLNPGSIARIFGYTKNGVEQLLYENNDFGLIKGGRMWNVIIPETAFEIKALKLLIVHELAKGPKQIDAIGISSNTQPIKAKINLAEELNKNQRENLDASINSKYSELAPLISPDGKSLFFTRKDHPNNLHKGSSIKTGQDIWFSKLQTNGSWSASLNIGSPVNNFQTNAAVALANDNTLFVLNKYLPNGNLVKGLSKTKFLDGKWTFPEEVVIEQFQALAVEKHLGSKETEVITDYAISHDQNVLIMALNRAGTYGDNDLYVSKKHNDSYSTPINLGPILNSAGNEGSPFLAADNKTLYFNSNGFSGYGDSDIFVSKRLDDSWTNWSKPKNLGKPINSSEWDGYFSISASGEYAFFSSFNTLSNSDDIFKIKLSETLKPDPVIALNVKFIDASTNELLSPNTLLYSLTDSLVLKYDEESKIYSAILSPQENYILNAGLDGYMDFQENLDYKEIIEYSEKDLELKLIPLKEGQKMVLDKLFFDQGLFNIREESYNELDKIIALMNKNPNMKVLLEGHTDDQGQLLLNVELSKNRVDEVKKYLVDKGTIEASRIETKAWGPTKPIANNITEESRKKNRRVEFTIIKM